MAEALDTSGVEAVSARVSLDDLSTDFEATVEAYREVGCETLVIPSADAERFADEDAANRFAEELTDLADRGMQLGYHNHSFEFEDLGGETALDRLVAETASVAFEFDVGLATFAGADPVRFLRDHADRIPFVHFTDTIPGDEESLHVNYGAGAVDLATCARVTREIDAEWSSYGHGLTDDPVGALSEAECDLPRLLSAD